MDVAKEEKVEVVPVKQFIGRKAFSIINGSVHIQGLNIANKPDTDFQIHMFSSAVPYAAYDGYDDHEVDEGGIYRYYANVKMRSCVEGEIITDFPSY